MKFIAGFILGGTLLFLIGVFVGTFGATEQAIRYATAQKDCLEQTADAIILEPIGTYEWNQDKDRIWNLQTKWRLEGHADGMNDMIFFKPDMVKTLKHSFGYIGGIF